MAPVERFVADLVPLLRERAYKGSGTTLRKVEGDLVFVVNFQRSRDGGHFFINLGGQPTQIPDEGSGYTNAKTLKEYECLFRTRVGTQWPRLLSPRELMTVREELDRSLVAFEGKLGSLSARIRSEPAASLLEDLPFGCVPARAALQLARMSDAIGDLEKRRSYVELGLKLVPSGALGLVGQLRQLESEGQ